MSDAEPHVVALPVESCIGTLYGRPSLADAYAIDLPPGTTQDSESLARFIFSHQPRWVAALMNVRDAGVSAFGLKTGRSLRRSGAQRHRIGMFKLYDVRPLEVLVGEDDRHLDFRTSVLYRAPQGPGSSATVVLSTVVHCHNLLGRTYLRLIAPFHRRVVQSLLRQAAAMGWPLEDSAALALSR